MNKNILITGGSGFIGSHLADELSKSGHRVTVFDNKFSKYINSKQTFIKGDLLNINDIKKSLKNIDDVFHFGALSDIDFCKKNPSQTLNLNILGTNNLLSEVAKLTRKPGIFFSSSIYVNSNYGSFYRISKQACENLFQEYYNNFSIKYTILRFGTVYGTRCNKTNAIFNYVNQAIDSNKIVTNATGEELREYIYVLDVAKTCAKLLLSKKHSNKSYILTGIDKYTVSEITKIIAEILDKKIKVEFLKLDKSHYKLTPYNYKYNLAEKIIPDQYVDLGEGIIEVIDEIINIDRSVKTDI